MPFKISNRCCWFIKEKPSRQYEQQTGRKLILGTMAEESQQRKQGWFKTGCNSYKGAVVSKPMSFWTEQDVLRYIKENSLQYCSIYGDIIPVEDDKILANHKLNTTECQRTGCMFCGFGLHLEKGETRFQRLKRTHPSQYNYCINGGEWVNGMWQPSKTGLGMGNVFDMVNEICGVDFMRYQ